MAADDPLDLRQLTDNLPPPSPTPSPPDFVSDSDSDSPSPPDFVTDSDSDSASASDADAAIAITLVNLTFGSFWANPVNPANPKFARCEPGLLIMVSVYERCNNVMNPAGYAYLQHRDWFVNPWEQMCYYEMCGRCTKKEKCNKYHPGDQFKGNVCQQWFMYQMDHLNPPCSRHPCPKQHPTVHGYHVHVPPAPPAERGRGRGRGGGGGRGGRGRGRGRGGDGGLAPAPAAPPPIPRPVPTWIQNADEFYVWSLLKFLRHFASHYVPDPVLVGVDESRAAKRRVLYQLYRELITAMVHIIWFNTPIDDRNQKRLEKCLEVSTINQLREPIPKLKTESTYGIRTSFLTTNTNFTANNWYTTAPPPLTQIDFRNLPMTDDQPNRLSHKIHQLINRYAQQRDF